MKPPYHSIAQEAIEAIDMGFVEVEAITINDGLDAAVAAGRMALGEALKIRKLLNLNGAEGPDY